MSNEEFNKHIDFNFRAIQAKELGTAAISSQSERLRRPKQNSRPSKSTTRTTKVVTGPPKILCLPRLLAVSDLDSAFLVRHECPWDTYQEIFRYDIAGEVIVARRRTHRSRTVTIRKYQKQDARRLIDRFGHLEHFNILRLHECYLDGVFGFFLVDDLPFTLRHISDCAWVHLDENELNAILSQVLGGIAYLCSFSLTHPSLECGDFLLGLDGVIKIARFEICVDCTAKQAEQAYLTMIPSLVLQLLRKDRESEETHITKWPIESAAKQFLALARSATSISALQKEKFITSNSHGAKELAGLVRQLLCCR